MSNKFLRISLYFILGSLTQVGVSSVMVFQNYYFLYLLSAPIYFLSGLIFYHFKIERVNILIFLAPVLFIRLLGIVLNKKNFPFLFPFDFLLSTCSFYLGYFIFTHFLKLKFIFLISSYLICFYLIVFVFTPEIYIKRKKIDTRNNTFLLDSNWLLTDLNNKNIDIRTFRNKVLIINFTSKSCGQCIVKMPFIEKAYLEYKHNPNVEFLEVDLGEWDTIEEAKMFSKKFPNALNWAYDPNSKLAYSLKYNGAPHEVIVDKRGKVRQILAGFNNDMALVYNNKTENLIEDLLKE